MVNMYEIPTRCPKCGCEDLVEVTRYSPDHHTWMCRRCYIDIDVPAEFVRKQQDAEPSGEVPIGRSEADRLLTARAAEQGMDALADLSAAMLAITEHADFSTIKETLPKAWVATGDISEFLLGVWKVHRRGTE